MKPADFEEYILPFPEPIKDLLINIRQTILQVVPQAEETISYGMPTFKLKGKVLLHFAAFKKHIGLYATPSGHLQFQKELEGYRQGKGSVQFPLDRPIPFDLIGEIAKFRAAEVVKG